MLKHAWITPQGERNKLDFHALSLESEDVFPDWQRMSCDQQVFPNDVPDNEKRHTMVIRFFDTDDLVYLRDVIDSYLTEME